MILSLLLTLGVVLAAEQQPVLIQTESFTGVILPSKGAGAWMPTKEQILEAEAEMEKHFAGAPVSSASAEAVKYREVRRKWKNYRRQYVGRTLKDKRVLKVHFLTGEFKDWRTDLILVKDGGTDFLEITFDMTDEKVIAVHIHGEA